MEFCSAPHTKRPVRLSEKTRAFAYDSLHYKYGLDTKKVYGIPLDDIEGLDDMTMIDKYDIGMKLIAKKSPIRICDGELVSGAATLGAAIEHFIPVTIGGERLCYSISHLTCNFEKVLKIGINGIRREVEASKKVHGSEKELRFLQSCENYLDAFEVWHGRYLDALKGKAGYEDNYKNLLKVPFEPAESFYEAVQSLWFTFAFLRLCGNWPGFGRLDMMLEPYLEKDIKSGKLTLETAREILAHFFIKGCEWVCGGNYVSGDAQHYQNIVLSGIDENGNDVTGKVTYLILDIIEELGISDFPTSVRVSRRTDKKLLSRVAEVIRYGGGIIALYNEDLVIDAMVRYGYPLSEARNFANDGCWEVQVPGKTFFQYIPFDSLRLLQEKTLDLYSGSVKFEDFGSLLSKYESDVSECVKGIVADRLKMMYPDGEIREKDWFAFKPSTAVSLFEDGCIEKACAYQEGGPVYNVVSPHIGGLPDAVNALYAIKKLVFDEKKVTFAELMQILKNNWEGAESLKSYVRSHCKFFGNDCDEVDCIAKDVLEHFADACAEHGKGYPVMFPSGVSTFGRQIEWAPDRMASAHGFEKGNVLSGNLSPTPGTDTEGATAIVRSYCKCSLVRQTTGAALDISLLPSACKGEDGLEAIISLINGFIALGGFFMQPDVTDAEILRCAQEHPEDYSTLSVRVSGWNARFVTLDKEWQNMIIERDS